jgi:hypothetical protein
LGFHRKIEISKIIVGAKNVEIRQRMWNHQCDTNDIEERERSQKTVRPETGEKRVLFRRNRQSG